MTRDGEDRTEDLLRRSRTSDAEALQALLLEHLPMLRAFVRVRMSPLLRAHESESDLGAIGLSRRARPPRRFRVAR